MNAINKGQPLSATAARADVTKNFKKLAEHLTPDEEKGRKGSFFSRLFKSN
jgi:Flp pilus assembly CpaE family ATPase